MAELLVAWGVGVLTWPAFWATARWVYRELHAGEDESDED